VELICKEMGPFAQQKSIQLECGVSGLDFQLACDLEKLLQVFSNIVGNAIKFSERDTRIEIRASRWGSQGSITVQDQGPGIPVDQLPHIFDRYWQSKETAHLGTGLGLAIAKGIVDAHLGQILVKSQLGKGTTFEVVLPTHNQAIIDSTVAFHH